MGTWTVDVGRRTEVLGPGGPVPLRPRERSVIAALALLHPAPAAVTDIASLVWGHEVPATARKAVHNHVLRLRRSAPGLVTSADGGYRLDPDVEVLQHGAEEAFPELADVPQVAIARAAARDRRLVDDERAAGLMVLELPADEACAHVASLVDAEPQRAARWWWLIVLTARLGRRREALDLLGRARSLVDLDHRGDIVRHLGELEQIILHDDPVLDADALLVPPFDDPGPARGRIGHVDPGGERARLEHLLGRTDVTSVALVAPSGSGKTSMCRAVSESLAAAGWTVAWCSIAHGLDPTSPFERLLDRLVGTSRSDDEPERRTLVEQLERAVAAPSHRQRLIVIDDVHFLTGDRLDWVRRLIIAAAASGAGTSVLLTSRDGEMAPLAMVEHRIRLVPWSRSAVETYLHRFVPASRWAREAAAWIHSRSGGNALFVRELTLDVINEFSGDTADTRFTPPDRTNSASSAAALRLSRLDESTRQVLAGAAVWGRRFRHDDLVGSAATIEWALAAAQAADVIERRSDGTSRFRHDAYRDALLTEVDDDVLVATGHRPADRGRAIAVAMDAADTAVAEGRLNDAVKLARRAAQLAEEAEGRSAIWVEAMVQLGSASLSVGADDAIEILIEAVHRAFDLGLERIAGDALRHIGRIGPTAVVGGADPRLEPLVEHALATLQDPAARAMVAVAATSLYGYATDAERTRQLYDDAVASARRSRDPEVVAVVLRSAYVAIMRPVDIDNRRTTADELDRLAQELDRDDLHYEACRLRITLLTELGQGDPRPVFREIQELAARFNERSRNWGLFAFEAMIDYLDGDFERAEHTIMRLGGPEVVASPSLVMATMGAHLLGLRLATGRVAELAPMVDDLVERQPTLSAWRAVHALTLAHTDRVAEAQQSFDSVVPAPVDDRASPVDRLPDDFTRMAAITALARAALHLDDHDRIRRVLPLLEPGTSRWVWHGTGTLGPIDLELALLHRALGDDRRAVDHVTIALGSAIRVGAPSIASAAASLLDEPSSSESSRSGDR